METDDGEEDTQDTRTVPQKRADMQKACIDIDSCHNYYKIIGVIQSAKPKVIKKAFKMRMRDVSPIEFMANWKQSYMAKKKLSEAYCVLRDDK